MAQASTVGEAHDRSASHPSGPLAIVKALVKEVTGDDVPGMAAAVAYHAIFSLPALIIVVIALAGVINQFTGVDLDGQLTETIENNAPESTKDILTSLVKNAVTQVGGGAASFGLLASILVALWAGSGGVGALTKAFNRAYDVSDTRSFPHKKGLDIGLTVILGLVGNLGFLLWVFGGDIGHWIADWLGLGDAFNWIWNISRWPLSVAIIIFMMMLLYWIAPNVPQRFRAVWPGAIAATVLWFALLSGFSLYLNVASPGSAYGALSGLLIFLLLLYFSSIIFIVGAELNAVLIHYRRQEGPFAVPGSDEASPTGARQSAPLTELALGAATTVVLVLIGTLGRRGQS